MQKHFLDLLTIGKIACVLLPIIGLLSIFGEGSTRAHATVPAAACYLNCEEDE